MNKVSNFKVGDKVRCVQNALQLTVGAEYTIVSVCPDGRWYRVVNDLNTVEGYNAVKFELVQNDDLLTPEEVFEHLRKGTKLELFGRYNTRTGFVDKWLEAPPVERITYNTIVTQRWRIRPEPEVIELNGKKYREIVE